MSGRTYADYSAGFESRGFDAYHSDDKIKKEAMYKSRSSRLELTKSKLLSSSDSELRLEEEQREERNVSELYDRSLIKNKITEPKIDTKRVHIVIVDNSGSNRLIAEHFKKSSGYFTSVLNSIDPTSQIAFKYYSDHCDGVNMNQEVDFISPNAEGDKILYSTLRHVNGASGGDAPEAFECALLEACDINFGKAEFKHLYLITDEVAHGMGEENDDGCPFQRNWKDSVNKVYKTFDSFEVIGCGSIERIGKLQTQFIQKTERLLFDLLDLSSIQEDNHRKAIVANALLFLISRKTGMQTIELFLSFLYEKWLEEHIFGKDSDSRAKEMIERFGKFIEGTESDVNGLMKKVLN
jgi:hypothetical protein